jgi:hypothetical protein
MEWLSATYIYSDFQIWKINGITERKYEKFKMLKFPKLMKDTNPPTDNAQQASTRINWANSAKQQKTMMKTSQM